MRSVQNGVYQFQTVRAGAKIKRTMSAIWCLQLNKWKLPRTGTWGQSIQEGEMEFSSHERCWEKLRDVERSWEKDVKDVERSWMLKVREGWLTVQIIEIIFDYKREISKIFDQFFIINLHNSPVMTFKTIVGNIFTSQGAPEAPPHHKGTSSKCLT